MKPIEPNIAPESFLSAIVIEQSYTEYRNKAVAVASQVKAPAFPNEDELEVAVAANRELKGIITTITDVEDMGRKPLNKRLKEMRAQRDDFLAGVVKEHNRLSAGIDAFQTARMIENGRREREAAEDKRKADQAAADAQRKIEKQQREIGRLSKAEITTANGLLYREGVAIMLPEADEVARARGFINAERMVRDLEARQKVLADSLLQSQLDAEEANLASHSAALQVPTNTPRGLVTKARYDFEIVKPMRCVAAMPQQWTWHAGDESLKFARAAFLKALNNEATPHTLLPPDGQQSIVHSDCGIRIYSSVTTHVRA